MTGPRHTQRTDLQRFAGRVLGVATMHGKERVIGPALARALPITACVAIADLDTDRFGAFTGEVERTLEPLAACRAKALAGAAASGLDLVIASEGSFGPYPPAPFVPCDEEFLALYDARDGRWFEHRHVSLHTAFAGQACTTWEQVAAFAERMRFPAHGLVLRAHQRGAPTGTAHKGIVDEQTLRQVAAALLAAHGACWVETDLRAMRNPTRMQVIAETAARFADDLARSCPSCGACWFRQTGAQQGLPCGLCGLPTTSIRELARSCWHCGHARLEPRPDGKQFEDPQHCENCNP